MCTAYVVIAVLLALVPLSLPKPSSPTTNATSKDSLRSVYRSACSRSWPHARSRAQPACWPGSGTRRWVSAIGLVLYFSGAVGAHLRKRDFKGLHNALAILVVAAAVLSLRAASL